MKNKFKLVLEISKNVPKKPHESIKIVIEMSFQWTDLIIFFIDTTSKAIWSATTSLNITHTWKYNDQVMVMKPGTNITYMVMKPGTNITYIFQF